MCLTAVHPGKTFIMLRKEKKKRKQLGGDKDQELLNDLFRDYKYFRTNSTAISVMCGRGIWGEGKRVSLEMWRERQTFYAQTVSGWKVGFLTKPN